MTPTRIALIKPSALGDIAHTLPVAHALRQRFPAARIDWIVNRTYAPMLIDQPDIDGVIPFDRGAFGKGVLAATRAALAFAKQLRAARYDLAIDLQCLLRTGLMCLATGAPRRVGLSSAREGARHCYTELVADDATQHAVDRYWRVATALDAGDGPKHFRLTLDPAAVAWAHAQLAALPRPIIAVGVGARWLTKRWPPTSFARLANVAAAEYGGSAVLIGAPDERDLSAAAHRLLRGPALDLCGRTTLPQLAAVLAASDLVLANDTGPLHLAAALGRPTVAPYTCTTVARHGPYNSPGGVATTVACAGSYRRRCDHLSCLAELTPDRLLTALHRVLAA